MPPPAVTTTTAEAEEEEVVVRNEAVDFTVEVRAPVNGECRVSFEQNDGDKDFFMTFYQGLRWVRDQEDKNE